MLIRAGFLRQAHSGIFHLLPLGLRVQEKLERLIDKHMLRLGASKVSLSSLSSEDLWARSGRLQGRDSEFLRLADRKGARFLLSPTHEEEITTIVANAVKSYKDLPLRLYQVSRKYRDEARPRQGLLRGREFLMKDLYTFDLDEQQARTTYEEVRRAYSAFLDDLRLPYLVATADSGNMGGDLSHEYHFNSPSGEDTVITCAGCGYSINEELFIAPYDGQSQQTVNAAVNETGKQIGRVVTFGISKDRQKLVKIVIPRGAGAVNTHVVKTLFADLDTSVEDALALWKRPSSDDAAGITVLVDPRCAGNEYPSTATLNGNAILLTKAQPADTCPNCSHPTLDIHQAVEIGHTFHLSTRYSAPLGANVLNSENKIVPIEMGCHGIGVSRLIGAVAGLLADDKGLNWPLAIAPFQALVVAAPSVGAGDVELAYDGLKAGMQALGVPLDVAIDDRHSPLGWKLNDADLVGYPFLVVLGRRWADERKVELQCRRLGVKENVEMGALAGVIKELASRL